MKGSYRSCIFCRQPAFFATFPGLGLGLYIASEIVKRHGGTIEVESKEGKGSKFVVTLPVDNHMDH